MTKQEWTRIGVAAALAASVGAGLTAWAAPGRVPPVVLGAVQRAGKLCLLLEGKDEQICAEVAAVASALAARVPARDVGTGGQGGRAP